MLWSWWKSSCDPALECDHPGGDWNPDSCWSCAAKVGFLGYSWWNLKIVEFLGDVILSDCVDLSSSQKHGTSISWKKQHICFVPGLWHLFLVSPGYTNQVSEKYLRFRKNRSWNRWITNCVGTSYFFSRKLSASQAFGGSKKNRGQGSAKQCTKFWTNHSYVCSKLDAVNMGMMGFLTEVCA